MKYIALKELPQGQQPGDEFETSEAMGERLVMVGAARRKGEPVSSGAAHTAETHPAPTTSRRRYHRTDLEAES